MPILRGGKWNPSWPRPGSLRPFRGAQIVHYRKTSVHMNFHENLDAKTSWWKSHAEQGNLTYGKINLGVPLFVWLLVSTVVKKRGLNCFMILNMAAGRFCHALYLITMHRKTWSNSNLGELGSPFRWFIRKSVPKPPLPRHRRGSLSPVPTHSDFPAHSNKLLDMINKLPTYSSSKQPFIPLSKLRTPLYQTFLFVWERHRRANHVLCSASKPPWSRLNESEQRPPTVNTWGARSTILFAVWTLGLRRRRRADGAGQQRSLRRGSGPQAEHGCSGTRTVNGPLSPLFCLCFVNIPSRAFLNTATRVPLGNDVVDVIKYPRQKRGMDLTYLARLVAFSPVLV